MFRCFSACACSYPLCSKGGTKRLLEITCILNYCFRTDLTEVFNKVRKIAGKLFAPPPPVLSHAGRTVADPEIVDDCSLSI